MLIKELQSLFEERQLVHARASAMLCPLVPPEPIIVAMTVVGTGGPFFLHLGLDGIQQTAIIGSTTATIVPLSPETVEGHLPS